MWTHMDSQKTKPLDSKTKSATKFHEMECSLGYNLQIIDFKIQNLPVVGTLEEYM